MHLCFKIFDLLSILRSSRTNVSRIKLWRLYLRTKHFRSLWSGRVWYLCLQKLLLKLFYLCYEILFFLLKVWTLIFIFLFLFHNLNFKILNPLFSRIFHVILLFCISILYLLQLYFKLSYSKSSLLILMFNGEDFLIMRLLKTHKLFIELFDLWPELPIFFCKLRILLFLCI